MPATRIERSSNSAAAAEPLCIEDLRPGDCWLSPWRVITASDVASFADLTGDHDPLHSHERQRTPFGGPIAHGLLGLGVLAGLSADYPRASTLALVGISDWTFDHPIFFGDRVRVRTEIELIEPHGRRAGRVTWLRKLVNQDDRVVQQGRIVTLVSSRARSPRTDRLTMG